MSRATLRGLLIVAVLLLSSEINAEPLEYVGKPVRNIPVSNAVKAGKQVFVSGTPAYDNGGKVAVGDFNAQIKQVMDNITTTLKGAGTD